MPTIQVETMTIMELSKEGTFEDILISLGEFGPFQIRVFVLLTLMDLSIAQCMLFYVYANLTPRWSCSLWNGTRTNFNDTGIDEWSSMCEKDGYKCEDFVFHGPIVSIISEWNLVCDRRYVNELSISLFFFGVLLGAGLGGFIADRFGRKNTLLVAASMQMLTQILVGVSAPWQTFLVLRIIVGAFVGTTLLLCFSMPLEFIGTKWRALCGSLGIFGLGLAVLTLWAYILPDWRHQAYLAGGSCLPLIVAIYFWVPESVRWLIQKGRFAKAETVISQIAAYNGTTVPDLSCLSKIALLDDETIVQERKYTYLDLFRDRRLARQTLILMLVWINGSLLYYGISAQLSDLSGSVYVNTTVASLTAMPLSWTVIWTANRFGRKNTYTVYNLVPCCAMIVILVMAATLPQDSAAVRTSVTVLVLLSLGGANAAWSLATTYTGELYATLIRNTSTGMCSMAARVAGIVAPQILLLGSYTHWTLPYVIYALMSVSSSILVIIYLPETNGQPLTETVPGKRYRGEKVGPVCEATVTML